MSTAPDEFDAILPPSAAPATTVPAAESHGAHEMAEAPSPGVGAFIDHWSLYRDPVLAGVLAGAALASLGVFVLLRRAVFLTAALSQAAGLGVALAFFCEIHLGFGVSPLIGALTMSALVTVLVGARTPARLSREAMVGFVFVFASALAVLIGDRIAQEAHDVAAILFGTAVLVRPSDLALLAAGAALSIGALVVIARPLTFTGLDPDGARVHGLPVRGIEIGFWSLFALEVSLATRALGSLPVFAFAVLPAATGLMLANRIRTAVAVAGVTGALSGGFGYLLAFSKELPVGAAQASTAAAFALVAFAISRIKGT